MTNKNLTDEDEYPPEPKEEDYILTRPPQSWCYVIKEN